MMSQVSEFPKHPHPGLPPRHEPPQPRIQPPTVFVYEQQQWEYRMITRNVADEPTFGEDELNTLGRKGWELVGAIVRSGKEQFYFKRPRP